MEVEIPCGSHFGCVELTSRPSGRPDRILMHVTYIITMLASVNRRIKNEDIDI